MDVVNITIQNFEREYLYSQLDRRIQLQNLVAGSINRNSKFYVYILKVNIMSIDELVV